MLRLWWTFGSLAEGISYHDFVNRPFDDSLVGAANPQGARP